MKKIACMLASLLLLAFTLNTAWGQEPNNASNGSPAPENNTRESGSGLRYARPPATLESVKVLDGEEGISLQIEVSPPTRPVLATLTDPDRLVLDFEDTVSRAPRERIEVNRGGVKSVRIGIHDTSPPMTRIAVDLSGPRGYELAM